MLNGAESALPQRLTPHGKVLGLLAGCQHEQQVRRRSDARPAARRVSARPALAPCRWLPANRLIMADIPVLFCIVSRPTLKLFISFPCWSRRAVIRVTGESLDATQWFRERNPFRSSRFRGRSCEQTILHPSRLNLRTDGVAAVELRIGESRVLLVPFAPQLFCWRSSPDDMSFPVYCAR